MPKTKTEIISIEGNIGSGKSTLVKILEERLGQIIEQNKSKLYSKSYKKTSKKDGSTASRNSLSDSLSDILMNNISTTRDQVIDLDLTSNYGEGDSANGDNSDKNYPDGILARIFKYIIKNAFGTKLTDWTKLKICFLPEPVDEWSTIVDSENVSILEKFYANQDKYAFSFQMMAYITRLKQLRTALSENYDIIITERCVHTDKEVFARMLYDSGKIEEIEFAIYNKWFAYFLEDIPKISVIYIQTEPAIAHNRVIQRARQGEFISLDYLTECHNCHERWLAKTMGATDGYGNTIVNKNLLILNGNDDHRVNPLVLDDWLQKIVEFLYS